VGDREAPKPADADKKDDAFLVQLRESEKRSVATSVLLVCVVGSFLLLLLTLFEILFHAQDEFLLVRCAAYKAAMFEADQSYSKYAIAVFGLAVGALATDVGRLYSWRLCLITAIVGFALAVVLAIIFDPATAVGGDGLGGIIRYCPTSEVVTDPQWLEKYYLEVEEDGEAFAYHLATGLKRLSTTLAAWYGSVAAALLGLNIDKVTKVVSRVREARRV
jgi:hypothetical protein